MRVLITTASKHGSTAGIAKAIQDQLEKAGIPTVRLPPDEVDSLLPYDAVILGSAVYAGHWLKEATDFITNNTVELQKLPVWMFSSGPVGEPLKPIEQKSVEVSSLVALTGAREHKLFAGKLDRAKLNIAEKAMVYAFNVKEGDYRDWQDIEAWSKQLASDISVLPLRPMKLGTIVR